MIKQDPLAKICTPNRLVRETYYSCTYRAKFSINKDFQYWDVTRISIPFSDNKEKELLDRLGLLESDKEFLISFYELFAKHIKTGWEITKELYKLGNSDAAQSFPKLVYNKIYKDDENGNIEIYTATDSLDPLIGSKYISRNSVSLLNLLQLAARFTVTLQKLAESGVHIGALDLDSIGLTLKANETDKTFIRFSSLLYGVSDNIASSKLPCLPSIPGSVPQGVLDNTEPITIGTDAYNLCGIIWSVCNGEHYTTPADFSRTPQNIPKALVDLLVNGCKIRGNDTDALKQLRNGFFALIKDIQKGKLENTTIEFNPLPFWKRPKPQEQPQIEISSNKDAFIAANAAEADADAIKAKLNSEFLERPSDTETKESTKTAESLETGNQTELKTSVFDSDKDNFSESTFNDNDKRAADEPVSIQNTPKDKSRTNVLEKTDISDSKGIAPENKQSDAPATVTPDVSSNLHNIPVDENSDAQTETEESTDIPVSSTTESKSKSELESTPESEQQFIKWEPNQLKSEREPKQYSNPEPEQKFKQKIVQEPEHKLAREPEQKAESNVKPESVHELAQNKPIEQPDAESYPNNPAVPNSVSENNSNSEESRSQPNVLLYPQNTLQQNNSKLFPPENIKNVSDSLLGSTETFNQSADTTEASNIGKSKNVEKSVDDVNNSIEQNGKETEHNADINLSKVKSANTAFPDFGNESLQSEDKQNDKAFNLDSVSLGEVVEITVRPSNNNSFKKEDFIQEQNIKQDVTSSKSKAEKNEKPVKAKKEKTRKIQSGATPDTETNKTATNNSDLKVDASKDKTKKPKKEKAEKGAGKHLQNKEKTKKSDKPTNKKTILALLLLLLCIAVAVIIVILNRQTSDKPSTNSSESVSPTYTVTESSTEPIETTFETVYEITITETPETPDASIPVESPEETEPAAEETDTPVETAAPTQTTAPTTATTTTTTTPQRPVTTQTPTAATPTTTVEPTVSPSPSPSTSPSPNPTVTPTSTPTPTPTATPTNEFYVSRSSVTVSVGSSFTVTANTECSWLTSDPTIATVSDGRITGVSAGTCIITAYRSPDGTTATITVTVK